MNERMTLAAMGSLALVVAAAMLWFISTGLGGLSEDLVYYWSPTELVAAGDKANGATVRLGGLVEPGSVDDDQQPMTFRVTDGTTTVDVSSTGTPPQMFREGIGVVVEGQYDLAASTFHTDRVMVKHSNEYRAPDDAEHPTKAFESLAEGS